MSLDKRKALRNIIVLFVAASLIAATPAAASSHFFATHTPSSDNDLSTEGNSYSYTIDVSDIDQIALSEFDLHYEITDDSFSTNSQTYDLYIDGEFVDGASKSVSFASEGDTGTYTAEFEDSFDEATDVSGQSSVEVKIEASNDAQGKIVTFGTSEESRHYESIESELSNPQPDGDRYDAPVELSVDLDVTDDDVTFKSGDGEEIATESGTAGSSVTTTWEFDENDIDENGEIAWSAETNDDSVNAVFSGVENSSAPELSNNEPEDGEVVLTESIELSIDVDDDDFNKTAGDEVEVTFMEGDGEEIHSQTISEPQTITTTFDNPVAGENDWFVEATDDYGNSATTDKYTFQTPEEIEIRDESNPDEIVTTEAEVEVQFFTDEEIISRTTDDGKISLSGLPADESMTVQVEADGYITRQSVVESILDQQDVYLLPDDVDSVETTFLLDDRTGEFPRDRTRIIVEKPITRDGETAYQTVVSDQSGPAGYSTVLERDSRYRLAVINEQTGERRVLGPYVTTSSETVNLEVDEVQFDSGGADIGYEWRADYINESSPSVRFDFQAEPDREIRDFELRITSRDGEIELINESYGTVDSVSETVAIPDDIEEPESQTWEVEWTAETDDGDEVTTISGGEIVGPDQMPVELPGVTDDVLHVVSVLIILLVAGLFSSANVTVGGVVTSLTAGGLWFVGATPPGVTGMFIATGLFVSIIAHLRTNQQVRPA